MVHDGLLMIVLLNVFISGLNGPLMIVLLNVFISGSNLIPVI